MAAQLAAFQADFNESKNREKALLMMKWQAERQLKKPQFAGDYGYNPIWN